MTLDTRALSAALAAVLFFAVPASRAQAPVRSYAVMSLAGNALSIHTFRHAVAARSEAVTKDVLPIAEQVFDAAALKAAHAAISQVQPGARVVLMMTQDAGLYSAQNAMFDDPAANKDNRDYLLSLLKDRGVTHLLLITKERDSARFKLTNGYAGQGSLEGLGFYIDDTVRFRNAESADSSQGMLGPFAYVKVRLLDASTLQLVRQARSIRSKILVKPSAMPNSMDMWTSMTSAEKIDQMESLLFTAMHEAVPPALAR
jgi:hypothetical protein